MDRLIATNSVAFGSADVAPGSGTPQYATSGNPGASIPATVFPAYAWNSVQDELMAIQAAAGITADKTNWSQVAEALSGSIANTSAVSVTSADVTLTAAQYRTGVIVCSGVLTGNRNVIFPIKGKWRIVNNCTGAFTLTAKTAGGSGQVIPQGFAANIWADGTNIGATNVATKNLTLSGDLTLSAGFGSIAYLTGLTGSIANGASVDIALPTGWTNASAVGKFWVWHSGSNSQIASADFLLSGGAIPGLVNNGSIGSLTLSAVVADSIRITNNTGGASQFNYSYTIFGHP